MIDPTEPDHVCPNCDSAEHVIPVWYSKVRFLIGAEPDHIGCTECREMVDNDPGELGIPDLAQTPVDGDCEDADELTERYLYHTEDGTWMP